MIHFQKYDFLQFSKFKITFAIQQFADELATPSNQHPGMEIQKPS